MVPFLLTLIMKQQSFVIHMAVKLDVNFLIFDVSRRLAYNFCCLNYIIDAILHENNIIREGMLYPNLKTCSVFSKHSDLKIKYKCLFQFPEMAFQ